MLGKVELLISGLMFLSSGASFSPKVELDRKGESLVDVMILSIGHGLNRGT